MSIDYVRYLSGDWHWTCSVCQHRGFADRGSVALADAQAHREVCGG